MNTDECTNSGMRDGLHGHVVRRLRYLQWTGAPLAEQVRVAKLYARHLAFDWQELLAEAAKPGPVSL
jgi:hypothetical protein